MGTALLVLRFILMWVLFSDCVYCRRPALVNVGVLFGHDSVIGRTAKVAMEAAVADINADPRILNGTRLNLIMKDTSCNVFLGSVEAFRVLEKEVVAIIGPQSSGVAHLISMIANGVQVPLVSFVATDPTLSALQFPFFVRTTQSDSYQMAAMADLIDYYGWREVIAIFVDDDYGRNGISTLDDELAKKMTKIYKLALPTGASVSRITELLSNSKFIGPRVYVVHVNPDSGLTVLSLAQELEMMTSGYVWLATDWLSTTLDSLPLINQTSLRNFQGVVGLRQHTPPSLQKKAFVSRWRDLHQKGLVSYGLNTYGLYAYDTVWAVAQSIDGYLNEYQNITFSFNKNLHGNKATKLQLENIKTFDGGTLLLRKLLQMNFSGLTGSVRFDSDRNLIGGGYDIINIAQIAIHTIGYWSNYSGLSVVTPETLNRKPHSSSHLDQKLNSVTWPGKKAEKPRGWVIADIERPLRIGVPYRASFVEFATEKHGTKDFEGFCIDVFFAARKLVAYDIPFMFMPFGDGQSNPNYDELVRMVATGVLDAAVGDIAIVTNRTKIADFTQPYAATGLVIVAPINNRKSSAWVFLKPFTVEMWCVTATFFVLIGVVIWILEHRINDDFRGPPRRQLITVFLFSFSTLFKTNQEDTISALGRMVMVVWLFLLMVITSSYTASLTSILTIQQLSSPITGLDSLITSSPEEYEEALRLGPGNGGVAAIIDELPYVELFLSKQTDFGIVGQMFTKNGWGFAFQRDSPLAVDMSTAILELSENGELQKIHDKWFCKMGCGIERRPQSDTNQLHLSSFWALYLLSGVVTLGALLVFLVRMVRQFVRYKRKQRDLSSVSSESANTHCSQVIYNFFDFIDEKEEAIKKMLKQRDNPAPQES
ncbi:PREDICTED: glutamate receptor 3.7-like isoform X2 [Nelumbo nucifera]|uniref:Glutamate receptor n=1 Tax=Nelumbo nucifera TaxID=4432 RepID=A0A1U8B518_NELNU|nr:PREDICTED: glutamate receptor 3.7-like isoform X2 [Nelumbo nucifera]